MDIYGEAIYRGGARLLINNEKEGTTRVQLFPVEIRFEKQDRNALFDTAAKHVSSVLINITEPGTKNKDKVILRTKDMHILEDSIDAVEESSSLDALVRWILYNDLMPNPTVVSKALSACLCCVYNHRGFKVYCDPSKVARYEKIAYRSTSLSASAPGRTSSSKKSKFDGMSESEFNDTVHSKWAEQKEMSSRNRNLTSSLKKPVELTFAESARRGTKAELQEKMERSREENVIAKAQQKTAIRNLSKLRAEADEKASSSRAYKQIINETLQNMDLSEKYDAKLRRDKIKNIRELTLIKSSTLPVKSQLGWKKGPVIGPGPKPVRDIALLKHGKSDLSLTQTLKTRCVEGSLRKRFRVAFDAIRLLAQTGDAHYLDFNAVIHKLDTQGHGYIRKPDLCEFIDQYVELSDEEMDWFWDHFDKDKNLFLNIDHLVFGFYNQRTLLNSVKSIEETVNFQTLGAAKFLPVENESSRTMETKQRNDSGYDEDYSKLFVKFGSIKKLHGIPKDHVMFAVVSICEIDRSCPEDTIVILEEKRSRSATLKMKNHEYDEASCKLKDYVLFSRANIEEQLHKDVLIEIRCMHRNASSDTNSFYVGEIFMPVVDLYTATSEHEAKFELKHGEFGGSIALILGFDDRLEDHDTAVSGVVSASGRGGFDQRRDSFQRRRSEAGHVIDDLMVSHGVSSGEYDHQAKRAIRDMLLQTM